MVSPSAMVVADHPAATKDLDEGLRAAGFTVRHATTAGPGEHQGDHPDVVLLSASLGRERVVSFARQFAGRPKPPTVLVFPQDDLEALETCVQAGFDYVMPPFRPGLLYGRIQRHWERSIAHRIQASFLPTHLPVPPGWELAHRFRPAEQPAGDFYDAFELVDGHRLALVVADVCDKGVDATLFMAVIRTLLRHTAQNAGEWVPPPGARPPEPGQPVLALGAGPLVDAVTRTNRYLARTHPEQGYFATLFFGVLDPVSGALLYINGGHRPAVLVRAGGEHTLLPPTGPAVGMLARSAYTLGHATINRGDALVLYTDGVVDARGPDDRPFGTTRLLRTIGEPAESAEAMLDNVDIARSRYHGDGDQAPDDDAAILALRRRT